MDTKKNQLIRRILSKTSFSGISAY